MGEVILRVPVLNGADAMIDSSDHFIVMIRKVASDLEVATPGGAN